jgi:hypothetical protein
MMSTSLPNRPQLREQVLSGIVTFEFYQNVYLPHAQSAQSRAVDALQRVSKGKVSASVLLGAKAASAPLSFRVLADSVAIMPADQLSQFVAQVFAGTDAS